MSRGFTRRTNAFRKETEELRVNACPLYRLVQLLPDSRDVKDDARGRGWNRERGVDGGAIVGRIRKVCGIKRQVRKTMPWFGVAEFSLVFLIFFGSGAGFGLCFPDPHSPGLALSFGGSAGIGGAITWALLCGRQKWRTHANWVCAGVLAGVLGHPIFALLGICVYRDAPFLVVPIVALLGFLFWEIVTIPLGVLAAGVCRAALGMLSPAQGPRELDGD
jgi:hypothetical protein